MTLIRVRNAIVDYPVYEMHARSMKMIALGKLTGGRVVSDCGGVTVRALDNITLDINDGDKIGLVGHNGAGKSTLLRLLAGVLHPSSGEVLVRGRVAPLIEKGLGLHSEFTGYENLELPLRLIGATDDEIVAARHEIEEFTQLGPYMKMPIRVYSEGMRVRLAFAICTAIRPDVLIMDEWLGASDAAFIERATTRLNQMLDGAKALVLATHALGLIEGACNRALWLERGTIVMDALPRDVIAAYLESQHLGLGRLERRQQAEMTAG
jgi:ABC-type polysaccharide/polyol phosphate transport system ATPase subunit